MNTSAATGDLHVADSRRSHLLLFVSRASEDRVSVRIDEPRGNQALAAVDDLCIRVPGLDFISCSDRDDLFALDCNGRVLEDSGIPHFGSPPCSRRAGAGDYLACVSEERYQRPEIEG